MSVNITGFTDRQSIEESGWSFTVRGDYRDFLSMADEWIEIEQKAADENMKRAQRLFRSEVQKTLGRQMARPSRANEPPRKIKGALQKSWKLGRRVWKDQYGKRAPKKKANTLEGRIQSTHPAAGAFEFGAITALGFGPRPYIRPTLIRVGGRLARTMVGEE